MDGVVRQNQRMSGRPWRWLLVAACAFGLLNLPASGLAALSPEAPFIELGEGVDPALAVDGGGQTHVVWLAPARERLMAATVGADRSAEVNELPLAAAFQQERGQVAALATASTLHVAYVGGGQLCYLQRSLAGPDWSTPECVPVAEAGPLGRVQMAALPDGSLALAWEAGERIGVALRSAEGNYRRLPDPSADTRPGRWPQLAVSGERLTLIWEQERAPGQGNSYRSEVLGSQWYDAGWSPPVSISGFDPAAGQWQARQPAVAVDEAGKLHVAFVLFAPGEDFRGPRNMLLYRQGQFDALQATETVVAEAEMPSLSVRGDRVEVAWSAPVGSVLGGLMVKNQEILWTARTGAWRPDRIVSHSAGTSFMPVLAMRPDDSSVAVWRDAASLLEPGRILLSQREPGSAWPAPARPDIAALERLTARADAPVAAGQVARSWLWGPRRWIVEIEPYADAPEATRTVAYYDKARIEVTNPNQSPDAPGYFTNGLLVTEMASGRLQVGDQLFLSREAALIPVAGDPISGVTPTYAAFNELVFIPEIGQAVQAPDRTGQAVEECLSLAGAVTACSGPEAVTLAQYVEATGHNIAAPFWEFLQQRGPVAVGEGLAEELVFDWVTTMGYPISEPVWITALIGGEERTVLVQLFQRRVLTYTPGNPAGFEVEMGNVGQHYYLWRYSAMPWQENE